MLDSGKWLMYRLYFGVVWPYLQRVWEKWWTSSCLHKMWEKFSNSIRK